MDADIPATGLHGRCVRIAIDGLWSLDESRELARHAAEAVRAAGGVVLDHAFVQGDPDQALRLWAGRSEPAAFAAGLRAVMRCLVDRPLSQQPESALRRASPRIQVNVALAPPAEPLSPLILDLLGSEADIWQLACAVIKEVSAVDGVGGVGGAGGVNGATACALSAAAKRLLAMRPERRHLFAYLTQLFSKLGLPKAASTRLLQDLSEGTPSARCC